MTLQAILGGEAIESKQIKSTYVHSYCLHPTVLLLVQNPDVVSSHFVTSTRIAFKFPISDE